MRLAALLLVVAACSDPPFQLRFSLTDGDSQACHSSQGGNATTDCAEVTTACESVLSVRIVPPNDPTVPYISLCEPLSRDHTTLCSIAEVNLPTPTVPVPEQVLEVQMAVFRKDTLSIDPMTGALICPRVAFGADNLPVPVQQTCEEGAASCPAVPAVGGRTYYYPGDEKTVVDLGCTNLEQLQSCANANQIMVSASVIDFDTGFSVSSTLAQRLTVAIGEPKPLGDAYELLPNDKRELALVGTSTPVWQNNDVDLSFQSAACLDISDESTAQSTATLKCELLDNPSMTTRIDRTGVRLSKMTLDKILTAIGKTSFPAQGIVIGIVLDNNSSPKAGVSVSPNPLASLQYLSDDLTGVSLGNATTSSGVFVSQDAAFGSTFAASNADPGSAPGFGGLVDSKVSIVVIRPDSASTNN